MALPTTEARFPGRCDVCDGRIEEGDRVARLPDGDGWVHASCAVDEGYETTSGDD